MGMITINGRPATGGGVRPLLAVTMTLAYIAALASTRATV